MTDTTRFEAQQRTVQIAALLWLQIGTCVAAALLFVRSRSDFVFPLAKCKTRPLPPCLTH